MGTIRPSEKGMASRNGSSELSRAMQGNPLAEERKHAAAGSRWDEAQFSVGVQMAGTV